MRFPAYFDNTRNDGLIICEREDFSDYMWMADEESFDKQVLAELQEEDEMEQCMEEMLAEEEERDTTYYVVGNDNGMIPTAVIDQPSLEPLPMSVAALDTDEILSVSRLNPEASEFVPSRIAHQVSPMVAAVEAPTRNASPPPPPSVPQPPPPSSSSSSSSSSSDDATLTKLGTSETPDR